MLRIFGLAATFAAALSLAGCGEQAAPLTSAEPAEVANAPDPAEPVTQGWKTFIADFREAAQTGDEEALRGMMSLDIDIQNSGGRGPNAAIETLICCEGAVWDDLRQALMSPARSQDTGASDPAAMIIEGSPACEGCDYGVFLKFEQRDDGWKWVSMSYPGD